ncbi:B3/B4 domain-containing protein [Sporosarcina sp. FA9]|uniref:B3/B4 domain-containing protein n=1 Tax=Sporosarcina sp. FA9 TaxID=3413030 RepID=UPI003F65BB9E
MKFELNSTLLNIVPTIKLGINHYTRITVSESPQMLQGRLRLFQEQLFFDLDDKLVTDYPEIKEWRKLWKQLGADPNRYRPSAEALLRRIKKQSYIDSYHTAVDLNNFFSLQHKIPIGIYDLELITGDVVASLGTENDGYAGLNGRFNSMKNIVHLSDDISSFGSPFVDSTRTSVTSSTTDALHVFYIPPSFDVKKSLELTTACGNMFTSMSGGDVRSYVVHEGQSSIVLDED